MKIIKKVLKYLFVLVLCLSIFGAGGYLGWRLRPVEITLTAEQAKVVEENPDVFTDLGTNRVIFIRGDKAIELFLMTHHLILADEQKQVILILDVPLDIIAKHIKA